MSARFVTVVGGRSDTARTIDAYLLEGAQRVRTLLGRDERMAAVIECPDAASGRFHLDRFGSSGSIGAGGPFASLAEALADPTFAHLVPAAPAARVSHVSWVRFDDSADDRGPAESLAVDFERSPAAALMAFFASELGSDLARLRTGRLECVVAATGPRPERRLMNWERDPMAEVSDGYLSNLAASHANLAADLAWRPRYCAQVLTRHRCPSCELNMVTRNGRYGPFLTCRCGVSFGPTTKKAAAAEIVDGFCGEALRPRTNHLGVPYAGCDRCSDNADETQPVSKFLGLGAIV